MVASQGGRHHCECNDPEIFQTTLSARQSGSCLSHYERVIDQPDSKIHSETECRCSQTHTVKWQEEMMFFCCEVDFRSSDYNILSKPVIQTMVLRLAASSIMYSYYLVPTKS